MVARRAIPAFVVALLMSGLLTWLLGRRLAHPPAVEAAGSSMQHLVAVKKDLAVGDTLEPSALQLIDWPATAVPAGAVTRMQDVAGRVLLVPMAAGQPVVARFLAEPGTGSGLMARIPTGMRAVSVHTDDISSVAGFVNPDSFVDVLVTSSNAAHDDVSTITLLQDVRVLAVGRRMEAAPKAQEGNAPVAESAAVTLLLSPESAQTLTRAVAQGKILLVLRNGADRNVVPLAMSGSPARPKAEGASATAPGPGRASPPHANEAAYTVETIAGGKQVNESFEGKK